MSTSQCLNKSKNKIKINTHTHTPHSGRAVWKRLPNLCPQKNENCQHLFVYSFLFMRLRWIEAAIFISMGCSTSLHRKQIVLQIYICSILSVSCDARGTVRFFCALCWFMCRHKTCCGKKPRIPIQHTNSTTCCVRIICKTWLFFFSSFFCEYVLRLIP